MNRSIIILTLLLCTGAAQADQQCALHQVASLDLKPVSDGGLAIPVTINGKPQLMTVDTSDPDSDLMKDYGDAENFELSRAPLNRRGHILWPNDPLYVIPDFAVGNVRVTGVMMHRLERPKTFGNDTVGELAADVLSNFDVEIDLKNDKLNLFSQDHCPGNVVYWTKSEYAAIPFDIDPGSHSTFQMNLDGKAIAVSFTLWTGNARMSMKTAKRVFDIGENSQGVTRIADAPADAPKYRFPFKSLRINGISISNPKIDLEPAMPECRLPHCWGGSDVFLGTDELKYLHLYFAFKEQVLYVTPADAR